MRNTAALTAVLCVPAVAAAFVYATPWVVGLAVAVAAAIGWCMWLERHADCPDRCLDARPKVRGVLVPQVEWHARHDSVPLEEERALDQESPLIMKQVVPPASRDELRQHHRDVVV
jgi:hypothetical protein